MAEALKFDFDKMNIRIQVINPGFVDTPLTQKNNFVDAGADAGRSLRLPGSSRAWPAAASRSPFPAASPCS